MIVTSFLWAQAYKEEISFSNEQVKNIKLKIKILNENCGLKNKLN